jgi:hypothetical protein
MADETKTTCPRRMNQWGPWEHKEGLDTVKDDRCSFCGGLTGDAFMAKVEAGAKIGPTDKNYKAYVDGMQFKFYYFHLSETQMRRFVDLYNEKKLVMDEAFYVWPFFMVAKAKEPSDG